MLLALPPLAFLCALAFRIRGGGFIPLTVTACRFGWGEVMGIVFLALSALDGTLGPIAYWYAAALVILGYLSLLVPHAAYQNMGRWASPQKTWTGFFLPSLTATQWAAMTDFERTDYDFGGMAGVGFLRGMIVFAPYAILCYFLGDTEGIARAILALVGITVLQPVAYLAGRFTNLSITSSLPADSAEWGEFWNGAAWSLALSIL